MGDLKVMQVTADRDQTSADDELAKAKVLMAELMTTLKKTEMRLLAYQRFANRIDDFFQYDMSAIINILAPGAAKAQPKDFTVCRKEVHRHLDELTDQLKHTR